MKLENIDRVIVGGESGNKVRPMEKEWVVNMKHQCEEKDIALFFKQRGTRGVDGVKRNKKLNRKAIDRKIWQQYPEVIRRQYAFV